MWLQDDLIDYNAPSEQAQRSIDLTPYTANPSVGSALFSASTTYNGNTTLNWLASLQDDGKLDPTLSSLAGDFWITKSLLVTDDIGRTTTSVPEPSSLAMLAAGLLGIAAMRRKSA